MKRLQKEIVDSEFTAKWCNKVQEELKNNVRLMRILKTDDRSLDFVGDITRVRGKYF